MGTASFDPFFFLKATFSCPPSSTLGEPSQRRAETDLGSGPSRNRMFTPDVDAARPRVRSAFPGLVGHRDCLAWSKGGLGQTITK